jgi:ribosomal protein S18 acetylase RimI-like enzyme
MAGGVSLMEYPPITLRTANQADIEFLIALRRASMWDAVNRIYPWVEEEQRERVLANFESAQIVCKEKRDIGLLKVAFSNEHVQLHQIQLLPEWQGKGIGCRLISNLQEEACSKGIPVLLNVFRTNSAIKLYTRLGFRVFNEFGIFYKMIWHPAENMISRDELSEEIEEAKILIN